jgi:3',5'-cyclic AMP phosphodiesterase CpdA
VTRPYPDATLWAVSDLHVTYEENREVVRSLHPEHADDWLIVAGDVAEQVADIEWALELLSSRFARIVWAPGNHELWTVPQDAVRLSGEERYRHLVEVCRKLGVVTPEDPYPVWTGRGGPAVVAPLFLLYDYTFRPEGTHTKAEALAAAYDVGVVCTDEYLLGHEPYPSREAWSQARVAETEARLTAYGRERLVLANHHPLIREPTRILRYPEFAQWCGTELTSDWHQRFNVAVAVYGHLHIPRTTWHDGVRFEEVSVGYPREWRRRPSRREWLRRILPEEA